MWVFGYGSLMWDGWESTRGCTRRRVAELPGYRRAFNKASVRNWGTVDHPCPTLNLMEDSSQLCRGVAFEFPDGLAEKIRANLVEREGKSFVLRLLSVSLDEGARVDALVPIYGGKNIIATYDNREIANMLAVATGTMGTGVQYVHGIVQELARLGIDDLTVARMALLLSID